MEIVTVCYVYIITKLVRCNSAQKQFIISSVNSKLNVLPIQAVVAFTYIYKDVKCETKMKSWFVQITAVAELNFFASPSSFFSVVKTCLLNQPIFINTSFIKLKMRF